MKDIRGDRIPVFKSLEEEREYWEARGPLAEGHKGTVNKPRARQKRSSFLAVRLTGEELTRLRDMAAKQGVGTSTFARTLLIAALKQKESPMITLDELVNNVVDRFSQEEISKVASLFKESVIGDPENPMFLVFAGERSKWEEFTSLFLERLLGVKVIPTGNENVERIREIVKQ
jgi:hypothetical protein